MVGGGFLVITVSHPTFCCVEVGVVVEVGLGCDNTVSTNKCSKNTEKYYFLSKCYTSDRKCALSTCYRHHMSGLEVHSQSFKNHKGCYILQTSYLWHVLCLSRWSNF